MDSNSGIQVPRFTRLACALASGTLLWLAAPPEAQAWGSIGHRVVGQVADAKLTPTARARVSKIMGTNSLGDVANWMDKIRMTPEGAKMKPWHYQSVSACEPHETACKNGNCAGPQIEAAIDHLKHKTGDQLKALSILVHLVGDIHQPLHAAENGRDYGGNQVTLKNRYCPEFGTDKTVNCNLHTYWDNMLVKQAMGKRSEKEFVAALAATSADTGGTAASWIADSNKLAETKAHNYSGFACKIGPNKVSLTKEYDKAATEVVTEQLAAAGQRLASILNDIYK